MAPVAPARTTRLESLVPAATPNTSPETETAPSSIPKVMSPIATRDCDIKRRSAPTAACNIRNLQVRPTDPTLAAGLEHRPGRFLLFGEIVAMLWAAGCRSHGYGRTGPVVGPGRQRPLTTAWAAGRLVRRGAPAHGGRYAARERSVHQRASSHSCPSPVPEPRGEPATGTREGRVPSSVYQRLGLNGNE